MRHSHVTDCNGDNTCNIHTPTCSWILQWCYTTSQQTPRHTQRAIHTWLHTTWLKCAKDVRLNLMVTSNHMTSMLPSHVNRSDGYLKSNGLHAPCTCNYIRWGLDTTMVSIHHAHMTTFNGDVTPHCLQAPCTRDYIRRRFDNVCPGKNCPNKKKKKMKIA